MKNYFRHRQILDDFLVILILLALIACTNKQVETSSDKSQSGQVLMNSLQGEGLDALELMIIFNARSSSFSWNRQIELSSSLTERLSKYFTDELRYRISMEGVDEPLLANGAKTIVPEGSICRMDFFGLLNSTVEVLKGEVGVLDGEIFVKDGTIAMIDSVKYQYANNLWLLAEN